MEIPETLVTARQRTSLRQPRHKGMYVMTVPDPDEFKFYDRYDATHYWCTCTQRALGPDGRSVHPSTCTHAGGRSCCET